MPLSASSSVAAFPPPPPLPSTLPIEPATDRRDEAPYNQSIESSISGSAGNTANVQNPVPPQESHTIEFAAINRIEDTTCSKSTTNTGNLEQQQSHGIDTAAINTGNMQGEQKQQQPSVGPNDGEKPPVAGNQKAAFASEDETVDKFSSGGNRWPREGTLALLKIRAEMDSVFRQSTLKTPLWEDISRRLAALGYIRSAKKCKEKFENLQKYYKRTKEGKAGRQDGKTYRFFDQIEALYGLSTELTDHPPHRPGVDPVNGAASSKSKLETTNMDMEYSHSRSSSLAYSSSFTTSSSSSSSSSSSDEEEREEDRGGERKRKAIKKSSLSSSNKRLMMSMFERVVKKVIQKQEKMQERFLQILERREGERVMREEAWRRQEMARLNREQEVRSQEQAMAATRDATLLAFFNHVTTNTTNTTNTTTTSTRHQSLMELPPPTTSTRQQSLKDLPLYVKPVLSIAPHTTPPAAAAEERRAMNRSNLGGNRWPKMEVLELIKLRTGINHSFQEGGAKGPLWEEISSAMARKGFNRSSKRCKEKWENINKYFKKARESNKKRPEDAKTCPYYHDLDALYKKGLLGHIKPLGSDSEDGHAGTPTSIAIATTQQEISATILVSNSVEKTLADSDCVTPNRTQLDNQDHQKLPMLSESVTHKYE